ncbi:MAG: hypothetical protein FD130_1431 [Halothiobacillaceae bacterium]|nr:MAG: hypothetical protein FD130_1431 [Halothiobacillaceae bacterium]
MKTTIELPDDLLRKAKAMAALRGQSMRQLITQLLQREVGTPPEVPGANARKRAAESFTEELEALAAQVSDEWQKEPDATAAVREQRRG